MNRPLRLLAALLLVLTTVLVPAAAFAQDSDIPPADITNDEGGPVIVTGAMNYTNPCEGAEKEKLRSLGYID